VHRLRVGLETAVWSSSIGASRTPLQTLFFVMSGRQLDGRPGLLLERIQTRPPARRARDVLRGGCGLL
jgi:hypothetical protein